MPIIEGTPTIPLVFYKNVKNPYYFELVGDQSGQTFRFKAWHYTDSTIVLDAAPTTQVYAASLFNPSQMVTQLTFEIPEANANLSFEHGSFSVHNETTNIPALLGPLVVRHYPEN